VYSFPNTAPDGFSSLHISILSDSTMRTSNSPNPLSIFTDLVHLPCSTNTQSPTLYSSLLIGPFA
jgi:hypothetical protein